MFLAVLQQLYRYFRYFCSFWYSDPCLCSADVFLLSAGVFVLEVVAFLLARVACRCNFLYCVLVFFSARIVCRQVFELIAVCAVCVLLYLCCLVFLAVLQQFYRYFRYVCSFRYLSPRLCSFDSHAFPAVILVSHFSGCCYTWLVSIHRQFLYGILITLAVFVVFRQVFECICPLVVCAWCYRLLLNRRHGFTVLEKFYLYGSWKLTVVDSLSFAVFPYLLAGEVCSSGLEAVCDVIAIVFCFIW